MARITRDSAMTWMDRPLSDLDAWIAAAGRVAEGQKGR